MEDAKNIGDYLREGRESLKLSLDDVSRKTKININILKALESNDHKNLPNIAYVRGFVKSYARTVKLDQAKATELLNESYQINSSVTQPKVTEQKIELNATDEEMSQEEIQESLISIVQSFFNKNIMIGLGIAIVLIIIINALVNWFAALNFERNEISQANSTQKVTAKVENRPTTPLKDASENILEMKASKKFADSLAAENNTKDADKEEIKTEVISQKTPEKTGQAKEATPTLAKTVSEPAKPVEETEAPESEAPAKEESEKKQETVATTSGKFPYQKFYTAPTNMFTVVENPPTDVMELLPQYAKRSEGKQSVYIAADSGDTWISYQKDGGDIKRYVMKEGRRLYLKGDEVLVFLGNYRATKIFYNGKLLEINPTRTGVKSLIFPPANATEYRLPLFPVHNGKSYTAKEYIKNMQDKP